jgi:hypothetical protein
MEVPPGGRKAVLRRAAWEARTPVAYKEVSFTVSMEGACFSSEIVVFCIQYSEFIA